jgi:hypothetical protein
MLVPQAASTGLSTGASTGTASFDQIAIVTGFVALVYVCLAVLLWRERTGRETVVGRFAGSSGGWTGCRAGPR